MKHSLIMPVVCFLFTIQVCRAQRTPQVQIESKVIQVESESNDPLGIEFLFGPNISTLTNIQGNSNPVTGLNIGVGINQQINPILSLAAHINAQQFGQKNEFAGGINQFKVTNIGADFQALINVIPTRKVQTEIISGIELGVNVSRKFKNDVNGVKMTDRPPFNKEFENRLFAGIIGGVGVTVRTEVGDFSFRTIIVGGLTEFFKDPNDVRDRSVPVLVNIPIVYKFFGRRENTKERKELIIFLKPKIIEPEEE